MGDFKLWFTVGVEHITDPAGYDHMLFVSLLVLAFPLKQWKKILILITGFTVGHSISLALSVMDVFRLPQTITEALIALTIFITAVYHLFTFKKTEPKKIYFLYFLIPLFGFIHGMGFSTLLRSMLGSEQNPAFPLLYFNFGIEAGQLLIVAGVMLLSLIVTLWMKMPFKYFKLVVSVIIALVTLQMIWERCFHS